MPKTATKVNTNKKPAKTKTLAIKAMARSRLPSVVELSRSAIALLWQYRTLFSGILLIYGLVNFIFVEGFASGFSVASIKSQFASLFHGHSSQFGVALTIYGLMLSTFASASSGSSSNFGTGLIIAAVASLAIIWAIRQATNGQLNRIRDSYYQGMSSLIPFFLIFLLIGLEILPMAGGISLYGLAVNNTIAVSLVEKVGFFVLMLLLSAFTLFFTSSSIFALYISTLPDMTPMKALRSARGLVKRRRLPIILRLLFLPISLFILSTILMIPAIIFIPVAASWLLVVLTLVSFALIHSYLYNFYRELIK